MKNILKHFIVLLGLVLIMLLPYFVFAQNLPTEVLGRANEGAGFQGDVSLADIVGKAINIFLSFLGVIFIALMLYGGFNWMTASGDEGKLSRAKDTIRRAIIGLVITVSSYAIWNFILLRLKS